MTENGGSTVLLRSSGEIEYPDFGSGFDEMRKHVGYQWFEVVRRGKTGFENGEMVDVAIVADEEGLMNTPEAINHLATDICGKTIVGDVFIVGMGKYDLRGLTTDEVSTIRTSIIHTIAYGANVSS